MNQTRRVQLLAFDPCTKTKMNQKNKISNKSRAQRPAKMSLSSGSSSVGMPYPWVQHGGVCAKGYVYGAQGLISGASLTRLFEEVDDFSLFTERMPFWDLEIMEFWAGVPRSVKSGRALFYAYAHKYMGKSSALANPAQGLARRYYDVMANGRYGAYSTCLGPLRLLRSSATFAIREEVSSLVRHRPNVLTRINGLVALDTLKRVIKECIEGGWGRAGEQPASTAPVT